MRSASRIVMWKYICAYSLIFLFALSVLGQNDWHRYPFRELRSIIASEQVLYDSTGKADMVVSAQPFPSKTRVMFTGKKRTVSEYGKSYIKIWNESRGMPASNADLL